jgi:hypothetical protein
MGCFGEEAISDGGRGKEMMKSKNLDKLLGEIVILSFGEQCH